MTMTIMVITYLLLLLKRFNLRIVLLPGLSYGLLIVFVILVFLDVFQKIYFIDRICIFNF